MLVSTKVQSFGMPILWAAGFLFIGFLTSLPGPAGDSQWYQNLQLAPLTPPNFVFPMAWSLLYVFLGLIGYDIFSHHLRYHASARGIFVLQMLGNWSWTPIFFYYHMINVAWVVLCLMAVMNIALYVAIRHAKPYVRAMLASYIAWLCFAMYLNSYICLYN